MISSIISLIKTFDTEEKCISHLEEMRWNGNVVSPFDPTSVVYKCKNNKYRCKNTGKYFNVRTGTMFDNTKIPLTKWFMAIYLITCHKKGVSSVQLAKDLEITQKSAWFMLHRIRACFGIDNNETLSGQIEIDESFIGGKNKNRHASKKVENSQGRSTIDKTPVLGMIQRKGQLKALVVDNTQRSTIEPIVIKTVDVNSEIFTDEWKAYSRLHRIYDHKFVKHNAKEYVKGNIHTNTIEGFWSLLKRGIIGIYHFVSRKHLQAYVNEFTFRYNTKTNVFQELLTAMEHKTTYKMLIA